MDDNEAVGEQRQQQPERSSYEEPAVEEYVREALELATDEYVREASEPIAEPFEDVGETRQDAIVPGAPTDPKLLTSYATHVAVFIWHLKERSLLKCISHRSKVTEWAFEHPNLEIGIWWGYIQHSNLFPLVDSSYWVVNCVVISTFVNRW